METSEWDKYSFGFSALKGHKTKVSKYGPEKTPYLDTFHAVTTAATTRFL